MKKVLVYGALGSQQRPVIAALKSKGIEVYAVTQNEDNFNKVTDLGAKPILGDMSNLEMLKEITAGMDGVSFVVPASLKNPLDGFDYSKNIIDAAKSNNVKHIVWNTSSYFAPFKLGNPVSDVKLDVRDYIQRSGVPYTIIESNIYLENLLAPYVTESVKSNKKLIYPLPSDVKVGWIFTADVGKMVASVMGSEEQKGKIIRVSGLENLTGPELAEKMSLGFGFDVEYQSLTPQEFGDIMKQFMDEKSVEGLVGFYTSIAGSKPDYPVMYTDKITEIEKMLNIEMTTVEEWARLHKDYYTK